MESDEKEFSVSAGCVAQSLLPTDLKLPSPRAFDGKNIPVQRLNPYFRLYFRRDSENEPL